MKNEEKNPLSISLALGALLACPAQGRAAEPASPQLPRGSIASARIVEAPTVAAGASLLFGYPALELRYRHPFGGRWALDGQLVSGGLTQRLRIAALLEVTSKDQLPLAISVGAFEAHNLTGGQAVAVGFGPGLVVDLLEGPLTLTAGIEVAVAHFELGPWPTSGAGVVFSPKAAATLELGPVARLVLEAGSLVAVFQGQLDWAPTVSVLVAW